MSRDFYRFGLLGHQVSYSLSPRIFNWAFQKTGLSGSYEVLDYSEDDTLKFMNGEAKSFHGLNVTVPYKHRIAAMCTILSPDARRASAVNTIWWKGSSVIGENTDIAGFRFALRRLLDNKTVPKRALVIGAGGAARAAIVGLKAEGTQSIVIAARDMSTARERLKDLQETDCELTAFAAVESQMGVFDLIVQATPVGGRTRPGLPLSTGAGFSPHASVMDLIYAPQETEFLRSARKSGARTSNGLPMLVAQAGESFKIWTGTTFPLSDAMSELLPQLEKA